MTARAVRDPAETALHRRETGWGARARDFAVFSRDEVRRVRDYLAEADQMRADHDEASFTDDRMAVYAAAYALVLAGEAAGRVSREFRGQTPEIPWGEIALTRHRLAHGVDAPDPRLVAELVFRHLPGALADIDMLLERGPAR